MGDRLLTSGGSGSLNNRVMGPRMLIFGVPMAKTSKTVVFFGFQGVPDLRDSQVCGFRPLCGGSRNQ